MIRIHSVCLFSGRLPVIERGSDASVNPTMREVFGGFVGMMKNNLIYPP